MSTVKFQLSMQEELVCSRLRAKMVKHNAHAMSIHYDQERKWRSTMFKQYLLFTITRTKMVKHNAYTSHYLRLGTKWRNTMLKSIVHDQEQNGETQCLHNIYCSRMAEHNVQTISIVYDQGQNGGTQCLHNINCSRLGTKMAKHNAETIGF